MLRPVASRFFQRLPTARNRSQDISNPLRLSLRCLSVSTPRFSVLDFNNSTNAYNTRSSAELIRAYVVFLLCRPIIVRHADGLLKISRKLLGNWLTDGVIRETFFKHFCGGEDAEGIKPTVDLLATQGIGSILDYAAESDIEAGGGQAASRSEDRRTIICRTYTYQDEEECDRNAVIFKQAIRAVKGAGGPSGFAAIKVTAMGPPELLLRVSSCLVEMRRFFSRLDLDGDGIVSRDEWITACDGMFNGTDADFGRWFDEKRNSAAAAPSGNGIDYVEWLETLTLEELPAMLAHCKEAGPLSASQLEAGELELLAAARRRARDVAAEATACGVRVLVDAEHTYFQPAIDLFTNELMRDFNKPGAGCTVFNTYQAYLKDAELRLAADMERAKRHGYGFACKVVRGAYVEHETAHALKKGVPNPIHDCIEDTHNCYNRCVAAVLGAVPSGAECMVATHNQESCELAVAKMAELGLSSKDAVYFGQLYGMSDHLTSTLGSAGYRAYKYLPWGPINEVTPYLLRRAQENSAIAGSAAVEMARLRRELFQRTGMSTKTPSMPVGA